jgi:beta-N-acetylhexosaminidase
MDLRTKVGQRLVITFRGPELTPEVAKLITDCRVGGVILFLHNIESLAQVQRLNHDLQKLAAQNNMPPMIISIDEEGGRVSRMPADGLELTAPSQMAQAAAGGDAVTVCAASTARRLLRLGFNLNFTPVLDVNSNPHNPAIGTRSFSSDVATVAELGAEAVSAYLAENFASCAKHFPGHGDTAVDSHLGLPVVAKSLEELRQLELRPFFQAVQAGVPAIMTAHIVYPEIEPESLPATLSPFFLGENGLLRRELGFESLIFTDALRMQAIYDRYGLEEASLLALKAGADIVMPLGTIENQYICYETMLKAAERGDFQVDASAARIDTFKQRFCRPVPELDLAEDFDREIEQITPVSRRSLTLLRNRNQMLPLTPGKFQRPLLVELEPMRLSYVENRAIPQGPSLFNLLSTRLPELQNVSLPALFSEEEAAPALEAAAHSDALMILYRNASHLENQTALIKRLLELNRPVALLAALDPYDLGVFEADALVATYAGPATSIRALAGLLLGEFSPQGHLPVTIPDFAERGAGMESF